MPGTGHKQLVDTNHNFPLLPLKDIVIFPHMIVPVFISEDICISAVEEAMNEDRKIFLSAFKSMEPGEPEHLKASLEAPFDVYDVGTICSIMRTRKLPDGRMKVLVQGLSKATVTSLVQSEPFPLVNVTPVAEPSLENVASETEALIRVVRENLEKVVSLGKILSPDILMVLEDVSEPSRLADLVAANLGIRVSEAQNILATFDPVERLRQVYQILSKEIEVYQMQVKIQSQAKEEIGRMQKEHFLREQMRAIKTELGDGDGKDELEALWKKLETVDMPLEAKEETARQIKRLERMHQDTSEATLTRTHIETLLALPWNTYSEDTLDLIKAKAVLDRDHYSLTTVKDRIVEYLAVKQLNPDAKSPILCFSGPPGVGKTSLGKSIAECMNKEFARISLGGVRDEADMRGHRKTYVGAYPGRIIQAIKQAKTSNPVIMLDEIDKLGSDHRGDPSSALLEILDPEQNKNYVDHYLGVGFDLSKVMFIANANRLDTIPAPLRDRLEIIEVSGYSEEEKLMIANQYLIPKELKENGLDSEKVHFSNPAVSAIISGYTKESGLRGLKKQISAICRKIARQYAEKTLEQESTLKLTPSFVHKNLGARKFSESFFHAEAISGVSLGLAYTSVGGEVLAIETNLIKSGQHKLVLTGQLGDVMKESAQAAISFIRAKANFFGIPKEYFKDYELHVHIPQGGIPKDGPSAGISLATSMLSALLDQPPLEKTAMTGEITLHGKVLPIGGLKEKLLAAQREGMKLVILPESNKPMFNEIAQYIKKKMKVVFVKDYIEAFHMLFPNAAQADFSMDPVADTFDTPSSATLSSKIDGAA